MRVHDFKCRTCGFRDELVISDPELSVSDVAIACPMCDSGVMVWSPTRMCTAFTLGHWYKKEKEGIVPATMHEIKKEARWARESREQQEAQERRDTIGKVVGDALA